MIFNSEITGRATTCSELCDPVTALAIASTGFKVFSAIQEGQAASSIAERNAEIAKAQTSQQLEVQDRERRLRRGANIASAGASGVGIESFGDILQSSAIQEEMDLLNIKSEGLLKQQRFESEASQAKSKMYTNVGSAILGGASSLYGGSSKSPSGTGSYGSVGSNRADSSTYFPRTKTWVDWKN